MKNKKYSWIKLKAISITFRVLTIIAFMIPLAIFMIVKRDTFFVAKSGIGVSGISVVGLILYVLGIKNMLGKLPKIVWFITVYILCFFASYLGDFLTSIAMCMVIGYVIALPLPILAKRYDKLAEVCDDAQLRKKIRDNVEVEVGD